MPNEQKITVRVKVPVGDECMNFGKPLTQNKYALVDAADFELVSEYTWYAQKNGATFYAITSIKLTGKGWATLLMHRLILNPPKGRHVDHLNHSGLDNRRKNIRLCTHSQNHFNQQPGKGSSRYKGVCWHKQHNKWRANLGFNGKVQHLGYFIDEIEAAKAYDRKALGLFGEFAFLNFPVKAEQG